MIEKISYRVVGDTVVRQIVLEGVGIKTSKLPVPEWIDRTMAAIDVYDLAWLAAVERPRVRSSARVIRAVDLFCGCGGLTLGIREAARGLGCGFASVFASDINKDALALYERNFNPERLDERPIEFVLNGELGAELTETEKAFCAAVGRVDVLVAGPPCQGNSNLNNYTRRDDPKNLLYLRAVRCAEILRPPVLLIENVPGVLHEKHGVLQTADQYLRELGYAVSFGVVPMWKIGVAQTRKRMILIASLNQDKLDIADVVRQYEVPTRSLRWAVEDLLEKYVEGDAFNGSSMHEQVNQERIDYLIDNDLYDLPDEMRPDCHRLKPHTYPSVYGRMHWDRPAPTITRGFACCGQGRFVHPLRRRTLTPHEAARTQFFPDFFDFKGMSKVALRSAIGNAVPAKAGYVLSMPLLMAMLESEARASHGDRAPETLQRADVEVK